MEGNFSLSSVSFVLASTLKMFVLLPDHVVLVVSLPCAGLAVFNKYIGIIMTLSSLFHATKERCFNFSNRYISLLRNVGENFVMSGLTFPFNKLPIPGRYQRSHS